MVPGWYEVRDAARTIHLCEECYIPDKRAGKRDVAGWEKAEQIWGERFYYDDPHSFKPKWGWDDPVEVAEEMEAKGEFFSFPGQKSAIKGAKL